MDLPKTFFFFFFLTDGQVSYPAASPLEVLLGLLLHKECKYPNAVPMDCSTETMKLKAGFMTIGI